MNKAQFERGFWYTAELARDEDGAFVWSINVSDGVDQDWAAWTILHHFISIDENKVPNGGSFYAEGVAT